jgi:fluoride ion exporter CrcB/FEX
MQNNSLYLVQGVLINIFQIVSIVSVLQYFKILSTRLSKTKKSLSKTKKSFSHLFRYFIISIFEIGLLLYVLFSTEIFNKNQEELPINTLFYNYLVYFSIKFVTTFLDKSSEYSVLENKHNSYIFSIKAIKFVKTILSTHSLFRFFIIKENIQISKKKNRILQIVIPVSIFLLLEILSYFGHQVRTKFFIFSKGRKKKSYK